MPYEYLTFNENEVERGPVSGSYLSEDLQSIYEQSLTDANIYFGLSEQDNVELSIYDSNQQFLQFNRIVPDYNFIVTQGTFLDENKNLQQFESISPSTNYVKYQNKILLDTYNHISSSNINQGLYYISYNFLRNVAGNPKNKLIIKEVSPSRREIKFSLAFNKELNEQTKLDYSRIKTFAEKKFLFIQTSDIIFYNLDTNEIEKSFSSLNNDNEKIKVSQFLGLKSVSELQEFIRNTYDGFSKILKYYNTESQESLVEETKKFDGVKKQIKNFCNKNNAIPFSREEILISFESIIRNVCVESILQKTTLPTEDLETCLNLFVSVISNDLTKKINDSLNNYYTKFYGYLKNAINFDNGNLIKILNHTSYLNNSDNSINIHVKLEEPLPSNYDLRTQCWISNISLSPFYFKINLISDIESKKIFLNGVNFDIEVDTSYPTSDEYKPIGEITLDTSRQNLKRKYNDLSIDYTRFENFIVYSSAELRTKIAKNKISEFESLSTKKNQIVIGSANVTQNISSSYSLDYNEIEKRQINLLDTFDEYESYLFFNSSSLDDKIIEGIDFDKQNLDSLLNQLPEYIQSDVNSSDYLVFTSMIGHFFDNILMYIKKFPKNYNINNDDKLDFPKNFIEELLNSFNLKTKNFNSDNSLLQSYLLSGDQNEKSYFDYSKAIFNRFLNNLPHIYKTKGTTECLELLKNIFSIPTGFLNIKEYGTNNLITNTQQHYEFEKIDYLTKFKNDEYINFEFTGSEFKLTKLNEFTSSITGGYNIVTSSYSEIGSGINSFELSFRWDSEQDVPTYNSKTNLIKKIRNDQVDWQLYLLKEQKKEMGKVVFELRPPESNLVSKIESQSMPIFNGNLFTVAVSRDILEEYTFDPTETLSSSFIEGDSKILQFITPAANKYLPYKYELFVNQTDGSLLNFFDIKSKICFYDQNKYFSSGSFYVGNFQNSNFKGNIDKLKVYKTKLLKSEVDDHSFNINSYAKENKTNLYSDLLFLWKFDSPIDLWSNTSSVNYKTIKNQNLYFENQSFTAFNFKGEEVILPYPDCTPATVSKFPYQFDRVILKQSLLNSNNYGPNYKNNPKISKINENISSNFTPYDYSTKTSDVIGDDSNIIGFYVTPYVYLESKIEEFLGKDGIINIIGNPENLDKQEYKELITLSNKFSSLNKNYIYPQEYYSTFKFYLDFTVFDYVDSLIPARNSIKKGLLLEPSVFERKKINIKSINLEDSSNKEFDISFDNSTKFNIDYQTTNDDVNNSTLNVTQYQNTIEYPLNYRSELIPDRIDDRDFIFSKFGKNVKFENDQFIIRDLIKKESGEYRIYKNSDGNNVSFFSTFDKIESLGSGSITGSVKFKETYQTYSGSNGDGYSDRHLSKVRLTGGKRSYKAISYASSTLLGVEILVVNEKWSTYQNNEDGLIRLRPVFGTGRNFLIYHENRDEEYFSVDTDEFITLSNFSGSIDGPTQPNPEQYLQSFTIQDLGVLGTTEIPTFKFDVFVGGTRAYPKSGGAPAYYYYESGSYYLTPEGSAIRVYDSQTGTAGDWIYVPNVHQIAGTEEFVDAAGIQLYYSGIDRDSSECLVVDGKSNEVIYGSRDIFLKTKIKYYDFVKSECNLYNAVDRNGNYKATPPIITINGFLNLRQDDNTLSTPTEIIPSEQGGFKFSPSVLTASLETSASLETYIYNL